jgi:hypothetical protein
MIALELIPRPLLVAVIAALFVTNGVTAYRGVAATTAAAKSATDLADLKTAYSRAISDAQIALSAKAAEYRDRERKLHDVAAAERKTYEKKLTASIATADALRLRLVDTPFGALHAPTADEAATATGANTAAGDSDGAELRRPFGLVDEALRAEKVRLGLLGCYRQYDEATSALK